MHLVSPCPSSTVEEKERNENYRFMKNADPQDVVIVLGVCVLIISIIVFCTGLLLGRSNVKREAQYTNTKARCKTVGGEWAIRRNVTRTGRKYR